MDVTEGAVTQAEPESVRSAEWSACNQVPHLSNGAKAALRRMYLTGSLEAEGVVVGLMVRAGAQAALVEPGRMDGWRLMIHAAAMISGTVKRSPYAEKRSLGRSLHAVGLSHNGLRRLVTARGPALMDQARRIARLLARGDAEAIPTNLRTLRELADPDPVVVETARRLIARDYFAAEDAKDYKLKAGKKGEAK